VLPTGVNHRQPPSTSAQPEILRKLLSTFQRLSHTKSRNPSLFTSSYSQLVDIVNTVATHYPSSKEFKAYIDKIHPAERFASDAKLFQLAFGVILLLLMMVTACRGYATGMFKDASPSDLTILLVTLLCIPFASSPKLTNYYFNRHSLPLFVVALLGVQFLTRFIQDHRRTSVYRICGTGFEGKDTDRIAGITTFKSSKPKILSLPSQKVPLKEPPTPSRPKGSKPVLADVQHAMFGSAVSGEYGATLLNPNILHGVYGDEVRRNNLPKHPSNDTTKPAPGQSTEYLGSVVSRSDQLHQTVDFASGVDFYSTPTYPTASTSAQIHRLSREANQRATIVQQHDTLSWTNVLKYMRPNSPPPKELPVTLEEIKQREQFQLSLDPTRIEDREHFTTEQHRRCFEKVLAKRGDTDWSIGDEELFFEMFDFASDDTETYTTVPKPDPELQIHKYKMHDIYLAASIFRWREPILHKLKAERQDSLKQRSRIGDLDIRSTTSSVGSFLNRETADTVDMEGDIQMSEDKRLRTSMAKLTKQTLEEHTRRERIIYQKGSLEPPKTDKAPVKHTQPPVLKATDMGGLWQSSHTIRAPIVLNDGEDILPTPVTTAQWVWK